jgi:hypothetical protein
MIIGAPRALIVRREFFEVSFDLTSSGSNQVTCWCQFFD